jgi:hypothetical protein
LTPGGDALDSPYPYHHEIEIDVVGMTGLAYVRCQNGPWTPIVFGPGSDYICHFNLPDAGGSGSAVGPTLIGGVGPRCTPGNQELGALCRQYANHMTFPNAWGFSVTEAPPPNTVAVSRGNCIVTSGDQASGIETRVTDCDPTAVPAMSDRGLLALWLACLGAAFVALRWRPRERASAAIA